MDSPKKILIVEDDQLLREFYQELLSSEGFLVDAATNGQMAYEKIVQGGYDLILLDIMMPIKDGLQVLKDLKINPSAKPNGPIVMLTNLGNDVVIKQCFNLGASGYLLKSALSPDQVLVEIHSYLNKTS